MINEALYMQVRILREFAKKYKVDEQILNRLFEKYKIYNYIEDCYKTLHTAGDKYIIKEINDILESKGVKYADKK